MRELVRMKDGERERERVRERERAGESERAGKGADLGSFAEFDDLSLQCLHLHTQERESLSNR